MTEDDNGNLHDKKGRFARKDKISNIDYSYKPENAGAKKNLVDYIDTILNGTAAEKEKLQKTFFKVTDTPKELKDIGLKGDHFTIRYGVISHHKNKDSDHSFTVEEWKQISKKLSTPLAVVPYKKGFNVFVDVIKNGKLTLVGMEVKSAGKNNLVNDIKTVFAKDVDMSKDILHKKKVL